MTEEKVTCTLCGEPMPEGEQMFNYHGYSGPCPKPPLPRKKTLQEAANEAMGMINEVIVALRTPEDINREELWTLLQNARDGLLDAKQ
jgi:hypothetical protein